VPAKWPVPIVSILQDIFTIRWMNLNKFLVRGIVGIVNDAGIGKDFERVHGFRGSWTVPYHNTTNTKGCKQKGAEAPFIPCRAMFRHTLSHSTTPCLENWMSSAVITIP
jgi:hypothetical protein